MSGLVYGSVCSGIEAATAAWHPLGWRPAFFSEIDNFPRAVLKHHYPDVALHGDFTTIRGGDYATIDVLAGGTPCQSFSVAGLRKGLDDERGNLALEFCLLARRLGPKWIVWENVPGVLSMDGGRAFASILGGLAECGYGLAYRVLDAQFVRVDGFGRAVPQRRRRVFVVGHLGDWRRAAAVLFERASLRGDPAPRRQAGERVAGTIAASTGGSDENDAVDGRLVAHTLNAKGGMGRIDAESETFVASPVPLWAAGAHGSNGAGIGNPNDPAFTLDTSGAMAVAFMPTRTFGKDGGVDEIFAPREVCDALHTNSGNGNKAPSILSGWRVRRLTPRECERLQGFPDDFTAIPYRGKPAADGPRYKALGNSMAVNVMRWIGRRIEMVEKL